MKVYQSREEYLKSIGVIDVNDPHRPMEITVNNGQPFYEKAIRYIDYWKNRAEEYKLLFEEQREIAKEYRKIADEYQKLVCTKREKT